MGFRDLRRKTKSNADSQTRARRMAGTSEAMPIPPPKIIRAGDKKLYLESPARRKTVQEQIILKSFIFSARCGTVVYAKFEK